jgi:hypothetical protein
MLPLGWNGDFMNRNVPITKSGIVAVYPDISTVKTGSYTGDNTTNRAIPHGLETTPKIIFIMGTHIDLGFLRIVTSEGYVRSIEDASVHRLAVTTPDTTNFYVGNPSDYGHSANGEFTYYWVAIA